MSDFDAVLKLKAGDRSALSDLFAIYATPAVRIAYSFTGSVTVAEDAVQEAFIQVLRNISSLRDPTAFRPWFYRIVVNAARRLSRNTHRCLPLNLDEHDKADPSAVTPDEAVLEAEEVRQLWQAIALLDEGHRVPIVLRYFIKLSEREIAEILGIPPGTVKSRLHTARRMLHQRIAGTTKMG
ncbi:MAG TPA: sigma-70 family RNA polymerase sigma factor [Symbiobacteriaceae bacterium]|nr:sigma-70 family RNA polymerase sigma factor [Symbiobacteriaceae bacterium]